MKAIIPQTITVPAMAGASPSTVKISAQGLYFFCLDATDVFQLQFDGGYITNIQPGMQLPGSFSRLTFFNATSAAITITFYTSLEPIEVASVTIARIQNSLANCLLENEGQIQITAAVANVANAFAPAGNYFRQATLIAQKSLDRAANVGNVYIGSTQAHQPITLTPGAAWEIDADSGGKRDLGNWWILAPNAGDGISIQYV